MLTIIALVAVTVLGTVLLVRLRQERAETLYTRIEYSRKLIGGIVLFAVAWTFLRSGNPVLILVAMISISLATLYVLVERPTDALT